MLSLTDGVAPPYASTRKSGCPGNAARCSSGDLPQAGACPEWAARSQRAHRAPGIHGERCRRLAEKSLVQRAASFLQHSEDIVPLTVRDAAATPVPVELVRHRVLGARELECRAILFNQGPGATRHGGP